MEHFEEFSLKNMQVPEFRDYKMADRKYEVLKNEIVEFQKDLSDDVDVCISLASFGSNMIMQVTEIGYQNPDIMYFYGYVNGNEAQLIQHVSQLNLLLLAVPKDNPQNPPRRIGFIGDERHKESDLTDI